MPRKGENIYKRKDGRWEGRYIKSRSLEGKAIYGYIYAKTYREVRSKLHEKSCAIASLEAQKSSTENELSGVENDLDSTGNELENKQNELEMVEEEKAQTLFEIQERARKTSNNISLAGGMYGAYAGVGGTLQNSLQTSLSSLTQAAGILGGSVDGASGGGSLGGPSGSGNAASGEVGTSLGDNGSGTGPLSAFTGGYSGEALPLSASQFSTNQNQLSTPATMPNYHSGQGSINTRAPQSFSTEQGAKP